MSDGTAANARRFASPVRGVRTNSRGALRSASSLVTRHSSPVKLTMPSPSPSAQHELATLIQSRVPLIALETRDESRALRLLVACCNGTTSRSHLPVFQWTVTEGLRRIDLDLGGAQRHNA